ncbi:MAG: sensor histidine kinase [Longimicrobiales bacterium]
MLSGIRDAGAAIERIAHSIVPALGDWCVVSVVDPELGVRRAASHHIDPAMAQVMDEVRARYAIDPGGGAGVAHVLRTNEPLLVPVIDEAYLRTVARDERHLALLRALGPRSAMYVPMSVEAGAIGVLTLASIQREYDDSDVRQALELAAPLALIVDNMRLRREAHQHDLRRRQVESDMATRERSFRVLFHSNPLAMWVYDLDTLRFLEVNDAAVARYGYTREEFVRMTILQIRPQEDAMRVMDNVRHRTAPLADSGIWRHCLRDGRVIDVHVRSHELRHDGRDAVLVVAEDITDRVHAQRQLEELNVTLERRVAERTAELQAANQELEAFSYSVSHDLRSPLRSIDGFSQALQEDHAAVLDESGMDYLRRIRAAAQRMGTLIDDLLRLARVTRNELNHTDVDLAELARRVIAGLREHEPTRTVEVRVAPTMPARGDRHLLDIALDNQIGNAWKFSMRNPQAVITVGQEQQNGETVYYVRDNGAGFDMEYAHKLFGVFQRLHSSRDYEGTGVGLAIVHRIISRHGGRIWAQGAPGAGATFYFTLS